MPTLEERVALLERIVNVDRYMSPRLDVDAWKQAAAASAQLPSGDLNVADRIRQIGISQDTIVEDKVPALASRVGAVERALSSATTGGGVSETRVRQLIAEALATLPASSSGGSSSDALPSSFQWPTAENGYTAPAGSGGPSAQPADTRVHRDGWVCVANVAPPGTSATSGPNGQAMGIDGRSRGKIRVNTRGNDGDGGMRDITNYVNLAERNGVGTITRRGYDIFCSVPDAISINTALWTFDANGVRDGGVFIVRRIDETHFIGNWSDPALDYENRSYVITGADQPDRDRFSTKWGADSNAGYGWRVDKPRNSTEAHATYDPNNPDAGFTDKGDFLLRLFHDNGSQDIGRYSRYKTFNEGRGIAFATSNGTYADCRDVLVMQPGRNGQPGYTDIAIDGYGLRKLETYDLPDGRKGVCFNPGLQVVTRD